MGVLFLLLSRSVAVSNFCVLIRRHRNEIIFCRDTDFNCIVYPAINVDIYSTLS